MTTLIKTSQRKSIPSLLQGIWSHLSLRRRIQLAVLVIIMFASGAAELLTLGAVFPFLAVLIEPERLWSQPVIQNLANRVGFSEANDLLIPTTFAFVVVAILAAVVRLLNLWLNGQLAAAVGSDLSCEAYKRTLYQPYEIHLKQNSSAFITAATTQIAQTVAALNQFLLFSTASVVAVGLIFGLLLINAPVAIASTLLFGTSYAILAAKSRRELRSNGKKITEFSKQQLKSLQEGLGAIRDVLLDSSQNFYIDIYSKADRPQRRFAAKNGFLAAFPRYTIEALGMVAVALLGGFVVFHHGSGSNVIPLLGAVALGAQRLLPALQQIYRGWASLKGHSAAMEFVLLMLDQPLPIKIEVAEPLHFDETIKLEEVTFRYDHDQPQILNKINLEIHSGEQIGLIGTTGSGKSTTVDILMGLLVPNSGRLLVDGKNIHDPSRPELLKAWMANISHVPQSIYLADSSIAENIAFGVPKHLIDMDRVYEAASQAQIADFIDSTNQGYESYVGERGVRLSGGQRQRIGIARALYKRVQLLVFDEATSALDDYTEQSLMNSINGLSSEITIIIIAHRLSTIKQCDRLFRVENGRLLLY